jgi:hypothetical protein
MHNLAEMSVHACVVVCACVQVTMVISMLDLGYFTLPNPPSILVTIISFILWRYQ